MREYWAPFSPPRVTLRAPPPRSFIAFAERRALHHSEVLFLHADGPVKARRCVLSLSITKRKRVFFLLVFSPSNQRTIGSFVSRRARGASSEMS